MQAMNAPTDPQLLTNPLLDFSGLPRFDAVRPEHVVPAIDQLLAESEKALETAVATDGQLA